MRTRTTLDDRIIENIYYEQRLRALLPRLTVKQMLWLWLWLNGHSHGDIAIIFGVTRQGSAWIMKEIKKKARQQ